METKLKNTVFEDPSTQPGEERAVSDVVWHLLGTLIRWRRTILLVTIGVAVASVAISLTLPKWYLSTTRLLAPESASASPISSAMLRNLSSAAATFLGGGEGGDFERYITIMSSRSVMEKVVTEFDLIEVYETRESVGPVEDALEFLAGNVVFGIDAEFGFLSVSVLDQDPQRAADMANFIVAELNQMNMMLSAQDASNFRRFVERRYHETIAALDSLKHATQAFQERYGVYNIETQASAFMEQMASIRSEEMLYDIQYQALLSQYGPDNPQVQVTRNSLEAARRKWREAMAGSEAILPIPQSEVPDVMRQYLELEQEGYIQKSILEVVAPMYDQARFQEEREFASVQVVDPAVPAVRKAKPKRASIVLGATFSAFLIVALFALVYEWWQTAAPSIAHNLRRATERSSERS
ncbi:MAG: Wzz/FepE/Etk N-terminal domain-containing protein [Rhodothermales bacterium]|nr:Wzz/FepE/Etk N-terminal domain-containing protein [Rhodothermales bacterium]